MDVPSSVEELDISLDFETLGTSPSAAILSLGATAFNIQTGEEKFFFERNFELHNQFKMGRTLDDGSFFWWLDQSEEARKKLTVAKRIPLQQGLVEFAAWVDTFTKRMVWANGTDFDIGIMNHAYHSFGLRIPYNYNMPRDLRTVKMYTPTALIPTDNPLAHCALTDARFQARVVHSCHLHLSIHAGDKNVV